MLRTLWLTLLVVWSLLCAVSLLLGLFPLGEALGGAATLAPETTLQVMGLPAFVLSLALHVVVWSAGATPLALFLLLCRGAATEARAPARASEGPPQRAPAGRASPQRQEPTL
jgi:hypothetical protein